MEEPALNAGRHNGEEVPMDRDLSGLLVTARIDRHSGVRLVSGGVELENCPS